MSEAVPPPNPQTAISPQEELRRNRQFVERVLRASPGTVYVLDLSRQTTVYLNRDAEHDLGYQVEELQALPPQLHPDDLARLHELNSRWLIATDDSVLENEIRLRHRNGEYRWRLVRETVFERDATGAVTKVIGVGVDITDRKRNEERRAYLLRLADAIGSLVDPVAVQDAATRILTTHLGVSRAVYAEFVLEDGREVVVIEREHCLPGADSFVGRYPTKQFGPDLPDPRAGFAVAVPDTEVEPDELKAVWRSLGVRARLGVPLVKGGRLVAGVGVYTTHPRVWTAAEVEVVYETCERTWAAVERARAEQALRDSRAFHELIAGLGSDWWFQARVEPNGQVVTELVSDGFTRRLGYTPEELMTAGGWAVLVHPDDLPEAERQMGRLMAGETIEGELRHVALDGTVTWSLYRTRPELDASGRVVRVQGVARDINDRKRAEEAVRATKDLARAVAANLPNAAAFVVDRELRYTLTGGRAMAAAGFTPAAFEGKTLREVVTPALADEYEPHYRRALAGLPFRTEHCAHGRHYVTHGAPLRDVAGRVTHALAVSYDITDRVRAEEGLRQAEERLRLMVESAADYAIITLAPDRTVTSWNTGAVAVYGYTAEEMVGRSEDILFTPEDRAVGVPEQEAENARREGRAQEERWHLRRDGSRFFASGVLSLLGDVGRGYLRVARDLTYRKRMEDELEERVRARTGELAAAVYALEAEMSRRRDLARRLATAQEDERRRVARDLHDSLGQLQAALGLGLAAARRTPGLPPAAYERLADVQRLSDVLSRETHALAVRLRPTALDDLGLGPALAQLVADWSTRTRIPVVLNPAGVENGRVSAEVETALYRMVQEALTNVQKHARARRVGVSVTRPDGHVSVMVEDDGVGFDPATVPYGRLGLVGMRERVELAGGTLEIESAAGAGTTVLAHFPLSGGGER